MCPACSSGYPVIGEVPWLFPDPRQALSDWRGRLIYTLTDAVVIERIKGGLAARIQIAQLGGQVGDEVMAGPGGIGLR